MKTLVELLRFIIPGLLTLALFACGTSSSVQSSHRLANDFPKVDQLVFIYRTSDLETVSSSPGPVNAWRGDTGYYDFGPIIAAQARRTFFNYGVKLVKASSIESSDAVLSEETLGPAEKGDTPVLLLYAQNSRLLGDSKGTIIRFLFSAQLIDPATKKTIWTASIDTRTINGKNLMGKAMAGGFDAKFADDILKKLIDSMRKDGVISGVQSHEDNRSSKKFANLSDVSALPYVNSKARENYQMFLKTKYPRAFVISDDGGWAWTSGSPKIPSDPEDPLERAMRLCIKLGHKTCRPYAVDGDVVW